MAATGDPRAQAGARGLRTEAVGLSGKFWNRERLREAVPGCMAGLDRGLGPAGVAASPPVLVLTSPGHLREAAVWVGRGGDKGDEEPALPGGTRGVRAGARAVGSRVPRVPGSGPPAGCS